MDGPEKDLKRKRPTLPDSVQRELWGRTAGRCEFRGCNKPLYIDDLTKKKDNLAVISHIIAFSADGPRGHRTESKRLEKDISNLMLTCRDHGKIIDSHAYVAEYPVELLREFKQRHEERIRRVTSISEESKTSVLILQVPIGGNSFTIDPVQVNQAILPRYPAQENALVIDLSDVAVPEDSSSFWSFLAETITSRYNELLAEGTKKGRIQHLSVFSLAPIPLLMHLGTLIGPILPADFFQRHRDSQNWIWAEESMSLDDLYSIIEPADAKPTKDIALILSISGRVVREEVTKIMGRNFVGYEILADKPGFSFLKSNVRLWHFANIYRDVLAEIRGRCGHDCTIHIFPAVPAPIAIECGRSLMGKCDPSVRVYDLLRGKGFQYALSLQPPSCKDS